MMDCSWTTPDDCEKCPVDGKCKAWPILEQGVNVDTVREEEVDNEPL